MKPENIPDIVTEDFLKQNPDCVFVFGDNLIRKGKGGAASLRDFVNSYGFITKKYPDNLYTSFYTKVEYLPIFEKEKEKLTSFIERNPDKTFLISKLGGGLANKHHIYESIIEPWLKSINEKYDNVYLLKG